MIPQIYMNATAGIAPALAILVALGLVIGVVRWIIGA